MRVGKRWVRSRTARFTAMFALLAGALTIGTADAATPNEGTVSDTSTSTSWSGGPFVTPNATGNALDQPDCSLPQSCDDYSLTVATPAVPVRPLSAYALEVER